MKTLLKKLAIWILSDEIYQIERDWFAYGVNQQAYEPETCDHARMDICTYFGECMCPEDVECEEL